MSSSNANVVATTFVAVLVITTCVCSTSALVAPPVPLAPVGLPSVLPGGEPVVSEGGSPILLPLRRESVPVRRNGEVVSFKTSYSGQISVGDKDAPQEFRVVFDTGSGQVVLPSTKCNSETCLAHQRYNISASKNAKHVNIDGTPVKPGESWDEITIGYGTGEVVGMFSHETLCLGTAESVQNGTDVTCLEMDIVMGVKMTPQPFKSFKFDGIVGLGLESLSLAPAFSFFSLLAGSGHVASSQFAFYLSEENGSEIALGGYNSNRIVGGPLQWAAVQKVDMGYWQVSIKGIRIGNVTLDICGDGSCRGVVDTGSSHIGIPASHYNDVFGGLTVMAGDLSDCRNAEAPEIEILLEGFSLTLEPENYMRQLPLSPGVNPGSATGVADDQGPAPNVTALFAADSPTDGKKCKPRVMPVKLAAPIGPNFFILGEPVLHRYYSVYDSKRLEIGFGLADTKQNRKASIDDTFVMIQFKLKVSLRVRMPKKALH